MSAIDRPMVIGAVLAAGLVASQAGARRVFAPRWLLIARLVWVLVLVAGAVALAVAGHLLLALLALVLAAGEALRAVWRWSWRSVQPDGRTRDPGWGRLDTRGVVMGVAFVAAAVLLEFGAGVPHWLALLLVGVGFVAVVLLIDRRRRPDAPPEPERWEPPPMGEPPDDWVSHEPRPGERVQEFQFSLSGRKARLFAWVFERVTRRFGEPPR